MATDISKMTLPELFKMIAEIPAAKRSEHLREIANLKPDIKTVLLYTYHSDYVFELPEGAPPYKNVDMPDNWGYNRLPKELRKFKYFFKGNQLHAIKREKIFIEVLESLSPDEAKLVLMMKDKKLTYKGKQADRYAITKKIVMEALPELFVGEKEVENV
jgi:hypothetical protein